MLKIGHRWVVLAVVMLAFMPVVVDMTILHIAVPSLTLALEASGTDVLWIIDIYPLLMAGLLVPMGTLADRLGHKRVLLAGLAVFGLASLAAAYSASAAMLIAARGGLAFGGAMIAPTVLALIRGAFEDGRERGIALGLWGTVSSAGAALGPLIGGFLLNHFWWGSVFLINVPIVIAVWLLAFFLLPRTPAPAPGKWTIGQAMLLVTGLITTVYAIKSSLTPDISLHTTILMLAAGIALLVLFVWQQKTSARPMLDLSLFAKPAIRTGLIIALIVAGALIGVQLTIAQELQYVIGMSPLEAGMFMLPLMIASAIGGPLAGVLVAYMGLRWVATLSLLLSALSLAGLSVSDFRIIGFMVISWMALLGFTLSVGLTASSIAIMGSAPVEKAGAAGALEATGYELGAGIGVTGFGVLLANMYSSALKLPNDLAGVPPSVRASIGETMVYAKHIGGAQGDALVAAARQGFSAAHTTVLLTATVLITILALYVFISLRDYQDDDIAAAH